jgi:hypothetical protein
VSKRKLPPVIEALSKTRGICRLTDENLKLLHVYSLMALCQSDQEMRRRGLASGEEIYLPISKPEPFVEAQQ